MKRTDGEFILLCTLPVVALIWVSAFFLFPGFARALGCGSDGRNRAVVPPRAAD